MKVADIMHSGDSIPLVNTDTPMSETLLIMTNKSFGCVGVLNTKGSLVGVITDGDLRRHIDKNLLGQLASDIMTDKPKTVKPNQLAAAALKLMNEDGHPITALFIVENRKPLGILHIHDLLRAGIV